MTKRNIAFRMTLFLFLIPALALGHGDEDHGSDFHIDIVHVMENGFHGKLEDKVVEVVLAPDAIIEKDGKNITIKEIVVGNSALVQGTKMPGNKIGASKVVVDKQEIEETGSAHSDHLDNDHSSHGEH